MLSNSEKKRIRKARNIISTILIIALVATMQWLLMQGLLDLFMQQ